MHSILRNKNIPGIVIHVFYPSTQEGVDLHEIELNLVHIVSPRTKLYSKNLSKKKKKGQRKGEREEGGKEIKEWSEQGMVAHILMGQRQVGLCELQTSLVYIFPGQLGQHSENLPTLPKPVLSFWSQYVGVLFLCFHLMQTDL